MIQINLSALTDTGIIRDHNEDNFIVSPDLSSNNWFLTDKSIRLSSKGSLLVVADGMGGTNAGEIASAIAVESVKKFFTTLKIQENVTESKAKDILKKAILEAHEDIVNHARNNPAYHGMGTTIIIAWVLKDAAIIGWCGDSRGYLFRPGEGLKIITKDHSLVWELVKSGRLTAEEADQHPDNNIITQSLGDSNSVPKPDFIVQPLIAKDILFLCSDGLNNMISTDAISAIVAQEKPLAQINRELIEAANKSGGHDNITAVMMQVFTNTLNAEKKSGGSRVMYILLFLLLAFGAIGIALLKFNKNNLPKENTSKEPIQKEPQIDGAIHPVTLQDTSSKDSPREIVDKVITKDETEKPDNSSVAKSGVDSTAQISLRIQKMEVMLKDWKQLSYLLDSIQEHQSQRHIDTLKTGILFELINRQREFEEYLLKYKFIQKVDDWKTKEEIKPAKLIQYYNIRKLDEELQNAQTKYDHIQKALNKITGKV